MLGGQPPFTGANAATITRQHMIANPPPITNLRPSVPASVVDALQRALSKSPADRFNPVAQFGAAISPGAIAGTRADAITGQTSAGRNDGSARRKIMIGMLIVAVAAAGVFAWSKRPATAAATTSTAMSSIAVLPFADLSADHSSAYLGDGVAETLINALVNVQGLKVIARNSSFSFRGRESDVKTIGKELGVQAVLTGSVQRVGDKLRITAQLVSAATGVNLWSNSFDRPASDIFAVQDEVAKASVDALKLQLAPDAKIGTTVGTRNSESYNAYLLGRFYWNQRTSEAMVHAVDAFKQSVRLDSMNALAWAGLSDAYALSISTEYPTPGQPDDSLMVWGERAARRSVKLDPTLGEAHISLANMLDARTHGAEVNSEFGEGIRLSPNYATGHQWYGYRLGNLNRVESIKEMEIAHQIDPLSHVITLSLAMDYDAFDRFAEATPLYAQGFAQSPDAWYAWGGKIGHEMALGNVSQAVFAYKRWLIGAGADTLRAATLEQDLKDSTKRVGAIERMVKTRDMIPAIAFTRWLIGEEAVIALLQRHTTLGRGPTPLLIMYGMLGPKLRADPRFRALIPKLGGVPFEQ